MGAVPKTGEWRELSSLTPDQALARGMGNWDGELFLFPAAWFHSVPGWLQVESILGEVSRWDAKPRDDDDRAGFLAYGVRIQTTALRAFARMLRLVVLETMQQEKQRLEPGHPDIAKWVRYEAWQMQMYLRPPPNAVDRAVADELPTCAVCRRAVDGLVREDELFTRRVRFTAYCHGAFETVVVDEKTLAAMNALHLGVAFQEAAALRAGAQDDEPADERPAGDRSDALAGGRHE